MNPFGTAEMAAGYANARPPVHPRIIERAFAGRTFERALDVGCGSGISTQALRGFVKHCVGIEPAVSMLPWAVAAMPEARFAAAKAEALPFPDQSFDLLTAAGSLNYADLDRFFPEAARVLQPGGGLLVYDFAPGRNAVLTDWFRSFEERYPWPPAEGRALSPETLQHSLFKLGTHEHFEIGVPLTREFYLNYMLTETNVAFAVRRGIAREEIRAWCSATLSETWREPEQEILFRGYFAWLELVNR